VQIESSTNAAWTKIFEKFSIEKQIEDNGIFEISAKQIAEIGQREPRLMAKFDRRKQRPEILSKNQITILPLSNGKYAMVKGDGYIDIPPPGKPTSYKVPAPLSELKSIPWKGGIHSEPQAIDALFMSSAVKSFVGDETLLLTIRGKSACRPFSFRFKSERREHQLAVDGAQIEIDSGYEGKILLLIEAKFGSVEDTIIRQIYYPFRHWRESQVGKKVVCLFLVYSNKIYSMYEFRFADSDLYQSALIARQVHYLLEEMKPVPTFAEVISTKVIKPPRDVPFPQADDISKIIDVVELLCSSPENKEEIAKSFDVDPRQGDYYGHGAAWLGLTEKSGRMFKVTKEGSEFAKLNRSDRLAKLATLVTRMPIFHEAAQDTVKGIACNANEIYKPLKRRFHLSESTAKRRAKTVCAWIQWLASELKQPG
jgi:hypothetical protein